MPDGSPHSVPVWVGMRGDRVENATDGVRWFLAWREGEPVAAAAMSIHGEVAVLGGAATLPTAR